MPPAGSSLLSASISMYSDMDLSSAAVCWPLWYCFAGGATLPGHSPKFASFGYNPARYQSGEDHEQAIQFCSRDNLWGAGWRAVVLLTTSASATIYRLTSNARIQLALSEARQAMEETRQGERGGV